MNADIARRACCALVLLVVATGTFAQQSHYEAEPNNTPAEANPLAGAAIVLGTMDRGDQDGFMWTVSDEDAQKRWVFELHGIPGRLTIAEVVRIELADNGVDVASQERLMKMGTRDGYTPAITRDLIFKPGRYLIGIAYAGGSADAEANGGAMFRPPIADLSFGDDGEPEAAAETAAASAPETGAYRFVIRAGNALGVRPEPNEGGSREDAVSVHPGREWAAFETRDSAWYAFDFAEGDTGQRWDIRVQTPVGRVLDATLFDADGQQLDTRRPGPRGHLEFPDVVPQAKTYYVQLQPIGPGLVTAIGSEASGQRVAGEEAEPNGQWKLANRVDFAEPLVARVNEAHESDYFTFSIDEDTADQLLSLRIESGEEAQQLLFCLYDGDHTRVQCRDSTTPFELPDLLLSPGEWGLSVTRAKSEFEYRISLSTQGAIAPGVETEPNDALEIASTVPPNHRIKGRASGRENDYYRFLVAEEPQLWRFQVIGSGILEISLHDGGGRQVAGAVPRGGGRRLRLDNVFLLPGKHYLRIYAEDGAEYTLLARPLGPPDPNGEREPNDDVSRMQRLAVGQTRTGLLSNSSDNDYYRFFLANWDHVRLTVEPPPDGTVAPHLHWYNSSLAQAVPTETGQPISIAGVFPPGDYYVQLSTREPRDGEYRLRLERLPRYSCPADCEPNGNGQFYLAAPLPPELVLEGVSNDWRDEDVYQLPEFAEPNPLFLRSPEPVHQVSLGQDRWQKEALRYDAEAGGYSATVPAGGPYRLFIQSAGKPYSVALEFENGPQPVADTALPAELALELTHDAVSAYRRHGQRVGGQLTIRNKGPAPLAGTLEATTSDYRWRAELAESQFSVTANGETTVPLDVLVPPDAWADRPVRVSVRAFDEAGAQAESWAKIGVDRELPPVRPARHWPIPEELRGGFNAAWSPFGAEWHGDVRTDIGLDYLLDNLVFEKRAMGCCGGNWDEDGRPELTLDLPGEEPLPVAGFALSQFGSPYAYRDVRAATLLLSEDGDSFVEALSVEALPVQTEQYFALPEPIPARFARLRIDETFNAVAGSNGVKLGEWKVILQPGNDLSGGRGFDLADPELGGHIVWDNPPASSSPVAILDEETPKHDVRAQPGMNIEYVLGFHEDRAAQIRRVEWINAEGVDPRSALAKVVVSVSTESPVGPWTAVGELNPGHAATPAVAEFDSPVWARFVKFTGVRQGDFGIAAGPNVIRIWERPTDDEYRSVLTEWGYGSRQAFYEHQAGIPPEPDLTTSDNTSRERAAPLTAGQTAFGQVQLAKRSHWYRFSMPDDANTLVITMSGRPTVRTVLAMEDTAAQLIPVAKKETESTPGQHVLEAFAEPGSEVYLHVYEPPRNVVFTWDTSASVGPYLPFIHNALAAFVSQVVPGRDSVNLLPFDYIAPLLDTWLSEPYMLQTIVNDHRRRGSSSSGEQALKTSARTLAPQPGTKAIVIITDGAVVHHGPMWKEMREVQPRIFAVGVGGEAPGHHDVMQDWASVNGGHFKQLFYQGEMEVAFDRAATLMRRPADYSIVVETAYREAPGPGTLQVLAGDDGTAATSAAIELILDASGSMLQRIGNKRRIQVAREVLTEAVREHIPAGTPVALRVFGHKEPGVCRSDLEIPLAPLDPDAAAGMIDSIQAKNLAKTPIADSLAAAPRDLREAAGNATIVLVTDGEETCEGDPAAVITSLQERGIEVTVNIVGFAIDEPELEAQFRQWAELGGGRYFSARNQEGLSEALREALQVPYSVYNSAAERVAEGLVGGEPVELDQGVYRVVVETAPRKTFDNVEIQGDASVTLTVKGLEGMFGGAATADPAAPSSAGSGLPSSSDLMTGDITQSVQNHLRALGYDPGNTSGELSTQTVIAISQFQAEKGMEVTGEVSPQLLGILAAEVDSQR